MASSPIISIIGADSAQGKGYPEEDYFTDNRKGGKMG
jgi:hypothetical protein